MKEREVSDNIEMSRTDMKKIDRIVCDMFVNKIRKRRVELQLTNTDLYCHFP